MKAYAVLLLLLGALLPAAVTCLADDRPLTIGVIAPMTGPAASYGVAVQNGISLAQKETGDSRTRYIYESVEYDAKQSVTAFQKLVNSDHVDLVYVWGVNFCTALAPLAEQNKKLTIMECVNEGIDKDRSYVVRFMTGSSRYMAALVKLWREKGFKKYGVVLTGNTYLEEMLRALQVSLASDESVTVLDRFSPSDNDFRSTLTAVKNHPVDALGVFLSVGQIGVFYKQLQVQHLQSMPTFGTNFFDSESERKTAQGAMDGAIYVTDHVPDDFVAKYRNRFAVDDDLAFAFFAYRFGKVVDALEQKGSRNVSKEEFLRLGREAVGPLEFAGDSFDIMKVSGDKAVVERSEYH